MVKVSKGGKGELPKYMTTVSMDSNFIENWGVDFGVYKDYLEDIDMWVHEFTEEAIHWTLHGDNGHTYHFIEFSIGTLSVSHFVTSLHCISGMKGDIIKPEEFIKYLEQ